MSLTARQHQEIVSQIGRMNIFAISGGPVTPLEDGIELKVGHGYYVRVRLTPLDLYTVSRIFRRNGKEFVHGSKDGIYCDEVGEQAYRASCYNSYAEGEW